MMVWWWTTVRALALHAARLFERDAVMLFDARSPQQPGKRPPRLPVPTAARSPQRLVKRPPRRRTFDS